MDATPIRLGQEVSGWAAALSRRGAARIRDALPELSVLGHRRDGGRHGPQRAPSLRALVVAELEALTGVPLTPAPNLFYAMQSLAPFVALSGALRTAALELLRIGGDVRLLGERPEHRASASSGFRRCSPGSSIMPGKVNPSMAEMLAMVSYQVVALDAAVALGGERRPARAERDDAARRLGSLPRARDPRRTAVRAFDLRCARGLEAEPARGRHYAERTVSLATALAPRLGYARAAEIVKASVGTGRSIVEVAVERAGIPEKEARRILDPGKLTRPGRA